MARVTSGWKQVISGRREEVREAVDDDDDAWAEHVPLVTNIAV